MKSLSSDSVGCKTLLRDRALCAILLAGLAFRLGLATQTTVLQPDEVWQYLEPGYGLVTGNWVRTWEFHSGIRGWLVPVMLVPPLWLGHVLAPQTAWHLYGVRVMLALLSLAVPAAWYDLGRACGQRTAVIAGWVGAIWCEVFYFAVRPSAEGIAMTLLFPALALARRVRLSHAPRTGFMLGLLLSLAFVVRFHFLPPILVILVWSLGREWRLTWRAVACGGIAGLAIGALCDGLTGHVPLVWIWRSIVFNVVDGGSAMFGTQPPWWYAGFQVQTWGWAAFALVPLIAIGAMRMPVLAMVALSVFAPYSLIAHKEYRFVVFGSAILVLLAAIGSVRLAEWCDRGPSRNLAPRWRRGVMPLLALGWFALDLSVALSDVFVSYWGQGDKIFTTLMLAGEQPGLCGLALYRQPAHPALAMSYVNRRVPTLLFDGAEADVEARAMAGVYNVAIASALDGQTLPAPFHLVTCWRQGGMPLPERAQCLFVRSGPCHGGAGDFAYQAAMERRGK